MTRAKAQTAALMASPDDAEAAFYEAMQQGDLDRMMAVWSDEEEIACVHPGGVRIVGSGAIRASFEALFANGTVDLTPQHVRRLLLGPVAVHHVVERVRVSAEDASPFGYVLVTNVYTHTPQGWRMVLHHASPGHPSDVQEIVEAPPGVLH